MTDRFSLGDERAKIEDVRESGVHGAVDFLPGDEEMASSERGDIAPAKTRTSFGRAEVLGRSGGEGGIDRFFKDPKMADPELLTLYKDYIEEEAIPMYLDHDGQWLSLVPQNIDEGRAKENFTQWLNGKKSENEKNDNKLLFSLSKINRDNEVYDQAIELTRAWNDPDAGVAYKKGENPEDDQIIFVSNELREQPTGRKNLLALKVSNLNAALKDSGIRMQIDRPKSDYDRHAVMTVLKHVKIGFNTFQGNNFAVEEPKKVEEKKENLKTEIPVDKNAYNLKLYQPALDRLTEGVTGIGKEEAEKNKGAVKDFFGAWTHAGKDEIESIGFGVNENRTKVTSVRMRLNDGTSITLPEYVFRKVFLADRYEGKNGTGIKFVGGATAGSAYIDAHTPDERLKEIMSKVKINGVGLQSSVRVFLGQF